MGGRGGDLHVSVSIDEVTATKPSVLFKGRCIGCRIVVIAELETGYAPSIPQSRAPRDIVSFRIDAVPSDRGSSRGRANSEAAKDPKSPIPRQFILF